MEALAIALLVLVLSAHGGLWYKMGRVEPLVNGHLKEHEKGE